MRNFILGLSVSLAFVMGSMLSTGTPSADAATRYQKCFGVKLYTMNGSSLNASGGPQKVVNIPKGWNLVGGSGAYALLCR